MTAIREERLSCFNFFQRGLTKRNNTQWHNSGMINNNKCVAVGDQMYLIELNKRLLDL